jgi:hypothetical protein
VAEKQKRMDWGHWKSLKSKQRKLRDLKTEIDDWKEDVCAREDMNCFPEELSELEGVITRGGLLRQLGNGLTYMEGGKKERVPDDVKKECLEWRRKWREQTDIIEKKMDELVRIYYPSTINRQDGTLTEFTEVHPAEKEEEDAQGDKQPE